MNMRNIDYTLGILISLTCISYIYFYLFNESLFYIAVTFSLENIFEVILIFIFAAYLAALIDVFVNKEIILRMFSNERHFITNYFIATIAGIITPGPVYSIFPIVVVLRKKGVREDIIVSYLTGQTLMGPMRVPLELLFLGFNFFVYRAIVTVIIGLLAGLFTRPIVNWIGGNNYHDDK